MLKIEKKEENIEAEIFKDLPWYEWLYQVSNLWNIKSIWWWRWKTWKHVMLKPKDNWNGYMQVQIYKDLKVKMVKVHKLVMLSFIGESKWLDINHKNWIKSDNRLKNLEYCTRWENLKHKYSVLWYKSFFEMSNPKSWKGKFWKNHNTSKKVKQFSIEWKYLKTWDCMSDVTRELWIRSWTISKCCRWKLKTAGNFIWQYI